MNLTAIAIFAAGAIVYGLLVPARFRPWALLIASVVAIFWLQPPLAVTPLDFVLPTAILLLAFVGWLATSQDATLTGENRLTLIIVIILVLALAVIGGATGLTASQPPNPVDVAVALAGAAITLVALGALLQDRRQAIPLLILVTLAVFVVLKSDILAQGLSGWLRSQTGRSVFIASATDIQWLGFSYISFRLIHTLRDRQTGKLPGLSLREYLTYLVFFPAYTAGPIDRAERFVKDYRALPEMSRMDAPRTIEGASRIVIGMFKKFVIADSLALFALNATKASQVQGMGGTWILLYAFAFQLYFDFSGYSDIAIGLGRLFGINLPENFDRPYLKDNITTFWQSWHATLSTWARFYVFTPLSRVLMNRPRKPPAVVVVLITQVATMVVIGLWHGITVNFVIWGVWHGVGLFVHKLFTDRTRVFYQNLKEKPWLNRAVKWGGVALTFHFVVLGWVWFALPEPGLSLTVFRKLVGG